MERNSVITIDDLLAGGNGKSLTVENVQAAFRSALFLPTTFLTIHEGQHIYRARAHNSDRRFHFHRDVSYRTDLESIKMERANVAKKAVFYGSVGTDELNRALMTVCLETSKLMRDQKKGVQTFTIGVWKVVKSFEVSMVHTANERGISLSSAAMIHGLDEMTRRLPAEAQPNVNKLRTLLDQAFSKRVHSDAPKETYLISAAFADLLMFEQGNMGVAYPSVETQSQGRNIALHPFVVEDYLEPAGSQLVQFHVEQDRTYVCQYEMSVGKRSPWYWIQMHPKYAFNRPWQEHTE